MIAYLRGQVIYRDPAWVIIDVAGVGYRVNLPNNLQLSLKTSVELYCSLQVREVSQTLYGFASLRDRAFFELLITVSGIGPKSALAILGLGSIDRLEAAIIQGDPTIFESVSGIGKKAAAKIIVELKSKLTGSTEQLLPETDRLQHDLITALEALGYRRSEILLAIQRLPVESGDLKDRVRLVLQLLADRH